MSAAADAHGCEPLTLSAPPEAWRPARKAVLWLRRPIDDFLRIQAASGILLLLAAAAALFWANSSWQDSYHHLWHSKISFGAGAWHFEQTLHFWINEFLMTVFFLVVGLEVKREIVEGELSELRRAALPIAAAIGGMVVPALVYVSVTVGGAASSGWGVPMATDIAFAVGVVALLGKRVPAALRVLLLALAIIDDIGAIIVIAIFYSSGVQPIGFLFVGAGIAVLLGFRWIGVRPGLSYIAPTLVIWAGLYRMGVHPTLAGVLVGMCAPAKAWISPAKFLRHAEKAVEEVREMAKDGVPDSHALLAPLAKLEVVQREAVPAALRGAEKFHGVTAFFIMPLFAFANAGVSLGGLDLELAGATACFMGITFGLAVGKPAGIFGLSWLATKLGLCELPRGVDWRGIALVGAVGGIGFTMAIFIAELAFAGSPLLPVAKAAVLAGTFLAATMGLAIGHFLLSRELDPEVAHLTPGACEQSTEY